MKLSANLLLPLVISKWLKALLWQKKQYRAAQCFGRLKVLQWPSQKCIIHLGKGSMPLALPQEPR